MALTDALKKTPTDPGALPRKPIPSVPVEELGWDRHGAPLDVWAKSYRVTVFRDYAGRPAVDLKDACKVADAVEEATRRATAERDARSAEEARLNDAYQARRSFIDRNLFAVTQAEVIARTEDEWPGAAEARAWGRVIQMTQVAEQAAGLPKEVQRRLRWPGRLDEAWLAEVVRDTAYHPPTWLKAELEG